jgi:hypothetical protein
MMISLPLCFAEATRHFPPQSVKPPFRPLN